MTDNKQYPPLPAPDTHCFDEDTGKDVWSYSADQMRAYVDADLAMRAASQDAEDAARYRRLRECNSGSLVVAQITGTGEEDWHVLTERDADEAIDAEINAARAKQEHKP